MVSEPIRLKYLKASDAQDLLRKVLSPKGDVKVDDTSNSLVLTDFPANVDRVKDLLKKMDEPPSQVLIEAKIVDITSKDLHNLGITWTADWQPAGGRGGIFHRATSFDERLKTTMSLAGSSSSLSGGQLKLDALTLKGLSVTATLDALIQDQKAHLLASPSIAVVNNQEARIIIGEKVPFKERTQTTTGTTETTKFVDVGTTLRVTPSINADGYITMRVHPEVSSVSALLDAGPRITTREADTTVRIKEGETIVIAGLIKQEDNRTKSSIPLIGQLPILDIVFGSRSKDQTQTELAVFITPRLLRSREEMALLASKSEAFVTIQTTGSLNVVLSLFQKADVLQRGVGLESRRKPYWFRLQQAMNLYQHIAAEFPESPQAPESLFRIATMQVRPLREFGQAEATLEHLLNTYPRSPAAPKAQNLLKYVRRQLERQGRPGGRSAGERAREEERRKDAQRKQQAEERRRTKAEMERRRAEEKRLARERAAAERAEKLKRQEEARRQLEWEEAERRMEDREAARTRETERRQTAATADAERQRKELERLQQELERAQAEAERLLQEQIVKQGAGPSADQ